LYPEAKHKVALLGTYAVGESAQQREIADPYHGNMADIRRCYKILDGCIQSLVGALFPSN
jgi:hypothetical protein